MLCLRTIWIDESANESDGATTTTTAHNTTAKNKNVCNQYIACKQTHSLHEFFLPFSSIPFYSFDEVKIQRASEGIISSKNCI